MSLLDTEPEDLGHFLTADDMEVVDEKHEWSSPLQPESEKELDDLVETINKIVEAEHAHYINRLKPDIKQSITAYIQANYISKDRVREAIPPYKDTKSLSEYSSDLDYREYGYNEAINDLKTKLEIE